MNDQMKEEFLQEVINDFSDRLKEVAKDVIGEVTTTYLPHALTDTEMNVQFQAQHIIEKMLEGKVSVDDNWIVVDEVRITTLSKYKQVATSIYCNAQKEIENATIIEMREKINRLTQELHDSYRNRY